MRRYRYAGMPLEMLVAMDEMRQERRFARIDNLHKAISTHNLQYGERVTVRGRRGTFTGTLIKINVTRIKVRAEDGRVWNVPANCIVGK